jgi:hypothetical protein
MVAKSGRAVDNAWRSFKLMEECLLGYGAPEDEVRNAIQSLRTVHDLRNILKGHSAPDRRAAEEKRAKAAFGSFRTHFVHLCAEVDEALDLIIRTLAPKKG